jgi:hypothetical protein
MKPLETNTDVLEPIIFCYLSTKDLGKQTPSEQIPLLNVIAYQMAINTQVSKFKPVCDPLNLNRQLDMVCAKIQLKNAVFMN